MPMHYKVGDVIDYSTFGGGNRIVLVGTKEADVKNGRPGFSGTLVEVIDGKPVEVFTEFGNGVWGYDSQINRIVLRSAVSA